MKYEFKTIDSYPSYEISRDGVVRHRDSKRIKKLNKGLGDNDIVTLYSIISKKNRTMSIRGLIHQAFNLPGAMKPIRS